jgi:hypothetical protein
MVSLFGFVKTARKKSEADGVSEPEEIFVPCVPASLAELLPSIQLVDVPVGVPESSAA